MAEKIEAKSTAECKIGGGGLGEGSICAAPGQSYVGCIIQVSIKLTKQVFIYLCQARAEDRCV